MMGEPLDDDGSGGSDVDDDDDDDDDDGCRAAITLLILSVPNSSCVSHVLGRVLYEYVLLRMISMAVHVS